MRGLCIAAPQIYVWCGATVPSKEVVDGVVYGTTAAIVAPAVVKGGAVLALQGVGFSPIGPVATSYAAAWMSSIASAGGGGVVSGDRIITVHRIQFIKDRPIHVRGSKYVICRDFYITFFPSITSVGNCATSQEEKAK